MDKSQAQAIGGYPRLRLSVIRGSAKESRTGLWGLEQIYGVAEGLESLDFEWQILEPWNNQGLQKC